MKEVRNDLTTGNNAGMPERLYVKSREESVCVSEWQHWWYPACMMLRNSKSTLWQLTSSVFHSPTSVWHTVLLNYTSLEVVY